MASILDIQYPGCLVCPSFLKSPLPFMKGVCEHVIVNLRDLQDHSKDLLPAHVTTTRQTQRVRLP